MDIDFHPLADAEFAAQVRYYENQQTGLGKRFYQEVLGTLAWISLHPLVPRLRNSHRRVNLKRFPLFIAYVIETNRIEILAVGHGCRKPGYWLSRLTN